MRNGILVDDEGEPWSDDSSELARRLGLSFLGGALVINALREHGFIRLREEEGGVHVTVPLGRFTLACLAGVMQILNELQPVRIIACMISASHSFYEMFPTVFDFIERAEPLSKDGPIEIKLSRIAVPRSLRNLTLPPFSAAQPLLKLWRHQHGKLDPALQREIIAGPYRRIVLIRQSASSSRMLFEHFGAAITIMRPCDTLVLVGRDIEEMYDRDYGHWATASYRETMLTGKPRLESMCADIRTPSAGTIRARYDRLLLPWYSRSGDRLALCISLIRHRSLLGQPNDSAELAEHRFARHPAQ
jgi:hypothetical protein